MLPRQQTPHNGGFNQFRGPQAPQGSIGPQIAQIAAFNGGVSAQNAMFQMNGGGPRRPLTESEARAMHKAMEMQRQKERLQGMALNGSAAPMSLNPELMIDSFFQANVSTGSNDIAAHPRMLFPHQPTVNAGGMGPPMRMPMTSSSMVSVASVSQQLTGGVSMPGQLPALFSDESSIPTVYHQALALCQMNNQLPNTALVYNLMVTSKLSRDTLGLIWSLVNRTLPGQLTRPEFFAYLALIALAQNGHPPSFQALVGLRSLPVPNLQLPSMTAPLSAVRSAPSTLPSPNTSALPSSQAATPNYIISTTPLDPISTARKRRTTSDEFGDFTEFSGADGTLAVLAEGTENTDKYAALKQLNERSEPLVPVSKEIDLLGNDSAIQSSTANPTLNPIFGGGSLLDEPMADSSFAKPHAYNDKGQDSPDTVSACSIGGILQPRSSSKEPSVHSLELTPSVSDSSALDSLSGLTFDAPVLMPSSDLPVYDKYAAIKQQHGDCNGIANGGEPLNVWMRCLNSLEELLATACQLFGQASSSTVCRSVLATERGGVYLGSIALAYGVIARIRFSLKTTTFQTDEKLVHVLGEIDNLWHALLGYAVGFEHILSSPTNAELSDGFLTQESSDSDQACGVCLLSVAKPYAGTAPAQLDYAGRCYHPQCANFWINRVDSLLPAVQLSTLL